MEEFSWLVGQIYDAVVDPTRWTSVLGHIADYTHAARVTLILEDSDRPQNSVYYQSYSDPGWIDRYLDAYMLINPMRLARGMQARSGDVILTKDFMSIEEYQRTRIYREFLADRQLVDIAAAVLDKSATSITVLSLKRSRHQGFADEDLRQRLSLIAPHVKRAAAIGRVMEQRAMEAATLADTLDDLASAVFLVDGAGAILHANVSARRMLDQNDILKEVRGRLVPRDPASAGALSRALAAAGEGDTALGTAGVSIPFAVDSARGIFGIVMPMTAGARVEAASRYHAVAAVCIKTATFETPSAAAILAELHDLTPRELMVLVAIVENTGVSEAAAVLGLSDSTIKSHLKSIFRKTGTTRQVELAKLLAGVSTPFGR